MATVFEKGKIEDGNIRNFLFPIFWPSSAGQFEIEMSNVFEMEGKRVQMLLSLGGTHTSPISFFFLSAISFSRRIAISFAHLTRAREMCSILTGANIAAAASPLFRLLFLFFLCSPLFVFLPLFIYTLWCPFGGTRHPDSGSPPDERMFDLIN